MSGMISCTAIRLVMSAQGKGAGVLLSDVVMKIQVASHEDFVP